VLGIVALSVAAAAVWSAADKAPARREVYPAGFADGEGRPLAERYCQICHAPTLVTQQAKDSTGWEKTIATMRKWGAPLSDAERDSLRSYFVAKLGPRSARP
jgi:mono/diheme cytochrome c family protein